MTAASRDSWSWKEQVALVTGAGRGIGAACARARAARGARVFLVSRTATEVEAVVAEIEAQGGKAVGLAADVSDEPAVLRMFERCRTDLGPPTLLVNCAAIFAAGEVVALEAETWDRIMAVNVRGSFLCAREAFRSMIASRKGGAIVNVSSLGGLRGTEKFKGFTAYSVSKFGVVGLTECLAVEGREHGIRVNCVAPGAVDTRMLQEAAPFLRTQTTPEDVARAIVYLCDGDGARAVSGTVLEIHSNL